MTPLEEKLAQLTWVRHRGYFTTIFRGIGFIVYKHRGQMWLVGVSKEDVDNRRKCQGTTDLDLVGYPNADGYQAGMFNIPATNELVSAVVFSAYPELT